MERITIIGVGPIGASIGLALKQARLNDTEIVATSGNRGALAAASKMGVADKTTGNLRSAVRGAQLVILDTPITDAMEVLEVIGPILDSGCVLTDTAAIKGTVTEWADQHLPKEISFVAGHPLVKNRPRNLEEAHANLFEGATYCVIPSKSSDSESLKTVVSLIETLGAQPYFMDSAEHDSFTTALTLLPLVVSAAFVTTVASGEGWRDMHRLATAEFGDLARLVSGNPEDNESICIGSSPMLVQWMNRLISELCSYRDQIEGQRNKLLGNFTEVCKIHAQWQAGSVVEDSQPRPPSSVEAITRTLLGGRLAKRYGQITGNDKSTNGSKSFFTRR